MIGRSGERWSRISVLAARLDDDDDDDDDMSPDVHTHVAIKYFSCKKLKEEKYINKTVVFKLLS